MGRVMQSILPDYLIWHTIVMASILELSSTARKYYEKLRAKSVYHGWEKYVLTDGTEAMFVDSSYEPASGEGLFYIQTRSGETMVELKKKG